MDGAYVVSRQNWKGKHDRDASVRDVSRNGTTDSGNLLGSVGICYEVKTYVHLTSITPVM